MVPHFEHMFAISQNLQAFQLKGHLRKTSENSDENNYIWHETSCGAFSRSFELTSDIVEEKIMAKFNNGVLNVTIPKAEVIKSAVKKNAVK